MKILDRYLVRELIFPIVVCSIALIFLILIADLFDNLSELLRYHTPKKFILMYYLSLVPEAFGQTIAWATWLGTLFLLVHLGFHNEMIAIKAAGVKITAIVKPILFLGFLIGIATFLVNDRLRPEATRMSNELRDRHITKSPKKEAEAAVLKNITYHAQGDRLYYFRTFSRKDGRVEGVIILWLGGDERSLNRKMVAKRGQWKDGTWEFENVTEFHMDSRGRVLGEPQTFPTHRYEDIAFTPEDLATASSAPPLLNYKELKQQIRKLEQNGVRVESELVDLHHRLAVPWQGLIMMLITIPILGQTATRKVIAMKVLYCVVLVFLFHVGGAVTVALGKAGKMLPFFSAWAGNIVFALGGLFYLDKANY